MLNSQKSQIQFWTNHLHQNVKITGISSYNYCYISDVIKKMCQKSVEYGLKPFIHMYFLFLFWNSCKRYENIVSKKRFEDVWLSLRNIRHSVDACFFSWEINYGNRCRGRRNSGREKPIERESQTSLKCMNGYMYDK